MNRLITAAIAVIAIIFSLEAISSANATENSKEGFKRALYKVEVSKSITDKPALVSVWRQYGELKAKWRTEIFHKEYPTETKYRYTFREEYDCRMLLANQWETLKKSNPRFSDEYLDNLVRVKNSRYFNEYIFSCFKKGDWKVDKDSFYLDEYKKWAKNNMKGSKKQTKVKLVEIELAEW